MTFKQRIATWDEPRILTEIDIRNVKLKRPELDFSSSKGRRLVGEKLNLSERLIELRNLPLPGMETEKRVNLQPAEEVA